MNLRHLVLPFVFLFASTGRAGVTVVNGPVLGHVSDTTARIWLQLSSSANVAIKVFDQRSNAIAAVSSDVEGPSPFVFDTPLSNLDPNTVYRLEITVDGRKLADNVTITTAPPPGDAATFSVAFGSGVDPKNDATALFKAVRLTNPREFLFLGNTGILPAAETAFPARHKEAFRMLTDFHKGVRSTPELQQLFHTIPSVATWSERDFGPAGTDRDFAHAKESLIAFTRFWPNPDAGTPDVPGVFFTSTYADADFFILDDRTYRHVGAGTPASAPAATAPAIFGNDQLGWLKDKLKNSTARFKVIAAGTPFLADKSPAWSDAPAEREAFIQWSFDNKIAGVIFISGGASAGELHIRQPRKPGQYALVEMTSSTLSADPPLAASQPAVTAALPATNDSTITDHNFGELEFGGPRTKRFVTLRLHDATGKIRLERTIFQNALQVP